MLIYANEHILRLLQPFMVITAFRNFFSRHLSFAVLFASDKKNNLTEVYVPVSGIRFLAQLTDYFYSGYRK